MRASEFIIVENKKNNTQPVKNRNPVAKNLGVTASAAGKHKDRKAAMKRGEVKHKGRVDSLESYIAEKGKKHISPSGVETNMDPSDDDYAINYGKNGSVAKFRKSQGLDVKTGKQIKEEIDFIFEETVGGFELKYTQHLFDRLEEKDIPFSIIQKIVQRIGRARKFIEQNAVERSVSLYDSKSHVHLIVTKKDEETPILVLRTAYRNSNYHGLTKVFKVR